MLSYFIAKRYLKSPKNTNAINIIAWITVCVIAFATTAQILVFSVYNGFEGLVKKLYADFYPEIKIVPKTGKFFTVDYNTLQQLKAHNKIQAISKVIEEKALLQHSISDNPNDEKSKLKQSMIKLKGVDSNYLNVIPLNKNIVDGHFKTGDSSNPKLIVGEGIMYDAQLIIGDADLDYPPSTPLITLPKSTNISLTDPLQSISEATVKTVGSFRIQQEFDNSYAITNLRFMQNQLAIDSNQYSAIEIKLNQPFEKKEIIEIEKNIFKDKATVQTRYQQNSTLYQSLINEKWFIFCILTLLFIVAAFNIISALSMLVIEKQKDISILKSLGANNKFILKIFLNEGLLLGAIGTVAGCILALVLGIVQQYFHIIKLEGDTFLIDYFPIKFKLVDFLLVIGTSFIICLIASFLPALRAANTILSLRSND